MHPSSARSGFTLSELLISLSLGSLLMAAVLSTYLFMGRSMTRTANFQILENKSRLALNYLRQDIQLASAVTTSTNTSLTLTLPSGTVSYTYSGGLLHPDHPFSARTRNRTAPAQNPHLHLKSGAEQRRCPKARNRHPRPVDP